MNENGTKRREWVKNAAIIFLSILLVLTFFSNTFMNYSLPEVAAQYTQSGSITAKIRGTGVVESGDPYNVQIKESRVVESVLVREGDVVQKGDPLFQLADKESTELTEAEKALDSAMLEFELKILSGSISNDSVNNVQSGNISSVAGYQNKIVAAEAEIEKWKNEVAAIELKISQLTALQNQLDNSSPDTGNESKKLAEAQAAYDAVANQVKQWSSEISGWMEEITANNQTIRDYEEGKVEPGAVSGNEGGVKPVVSEAEYLAAKQNNIVLQGRIDANNQKIGEKQAELSDLKAKLDKAQADFNNKNNSHTNDSHSIGIQLGNWRLELEDKNKKLTAATEAKTQLLADIASELQLDSQMEQIAEQRELVAELRANAVGAVIEAPISGTISSINITAGEETKADTPIATMQPEGKGFTMSFSVTNEQAKRLSPGAAAELTNSWRYDDVTVTLASIKPDPQEPAQKKLLTFDVTGSVIAGQSLSVSVGDRSANYDIIVPNSAIREDNNGKFVLIVETKPSPLGNRYKAARVDVEVVASDDTQSAITGGLEGYEFVITTSNKPVEAGQLVRLADN